MEFNSVLTNKRLNLRFIDVTYKVNAWTNEFKIGMNIIISYSYSNNLTYFSNTFVIEKKTILNSVSGNFYQGQLCAIIGCSGSGKSSLLNVLSGYK